MAEVTSKDMVEAKTKDGRYLFTRQEWLSTNQVKYLFAKFAKEKKEGTLEPPKPEEIEEVIHRNLQLEFH